MRSNAMSFAGGEIAPEMRGRIDDTKYQTGLALCRNCIVKPQGPVSNRQGTKFVRRTRVADKKAVVIPFIYSSTQSLCLEIGEGYFRFHTNGQTLLVGAQPSYNPATAYVIGDLCSTGGVVYYCRAATTGNAPPNASYWHAMPSTGEYEIPNSYAEADLFKIRYTQSNDVMTLVNVNYAPSEMRRYDAARWTFPPIQFVSTLIAPSPGATPNLSSVQDIYSYVVTSLDSSGLEESLPSGVASCTNYFLGTEHEGLIASNTVAWSAISGAGRYNIYKQSNGLFGYIGQTDGLSFTDDNITADVARTPPIANNPFSGSGNYPGSVSYFSQRRCFAGTLNKPQNLWMTRSGTESNLAYSLPTRDDDSISIRAAAREASAINHLVSLSNLILLTSSSEWRLTSLNSDAITPTSVSVSPQSYVGAGDAQPVIVNNNIVYAEARGGHLREMGYSWQSNGYVIGDLSLRAPHLFDGFKLTSLAYAKSPIPIVFSTSTSGNLIGVTYVPEQQIGAVHWHDSYTMAGRSDIESACVVPEDDGDALYLVVRRDIDGASVRYIERLMFQRASSLADAYFVDCGAVHDCGGIATSTLSGLDWLEGEVVNVLADGAVQSQKTVTDGAIALDHPATNKIAVGLPITADIKTLPLAYQVDGYGQGRPKNVNKAWLRVEQSSGIAAGPSFDKLVEYKQRSTEPFGSPPSLASGEIGVALPAAWSDDGAVCVRHTSPLPLTILSMCLDFTTGG